MKVHAASSTYSQPGMVPHVSAGHHHANVAYATSAAATPVTCPTQHSSSRPDR
jgi:hypothetical protein